MASFGGHVDLLTLRAPRPRATRGVSPVLLLRRTGGFTSPVHGARRRFKPGHGGTELAAQEAAGTGKARPEHGALGTKRGSPCRGAGRTCAGRGRAPGRPRTTRRAAARAAGRTDPSTGPSRTPRGCGAAGPWPGGLSPAAAPGPRAPAPAAPRADCIRVRGAPVGGGGPLSRLAASPPSLASHWLSAPRSVTAAAGSSLPGLGPLRHPGLCRVPGRRRPGHGRCPPRHSGPCKPRRKGSGGFKRSSFNGSPGRSRALRGRYATRARWPGEASWDPSRALSSCFGERRRRARSALCSGGRSSSSLPWAVRHSWRGEKPQVSAAETLQRVSRVTEGSPSA